MTKKPVALRNLVIDAFLATMLVFAVYGTGKLFFSLTQRVLSLETLNPVHDALDVVKEGYENFAHLRTHARVGSHPVLPILVDMGAADRTRIAVVLDTIARHNPRVIGLDLAFDKPGVAYDSNLYGVLQRLERSGKLLRAVAYKVTLGHRLRQYERPLSKSVLPITENRYQIGPQGYADFSLNKSEDMVRHFTPWSQGDTSFAGQLVARYDPKAWQRFIRHRHGQEDNEDERILYQPPGVVTDTLHERDFTPGNPRLIKLRDALVLVGSMAGYQNLYTNEDIHPVPTGNGALSGLEINAHIVAMLLNDSYPTRGSVGWQLVLSFLLCWALIVVFIFYHHYKWFNELFKVSQLLVAAIILFASFIAFIRYRLEIDPLLFIVPVALSVDVLYFYEKLSKRLQNWVSTNSFFQALQRKSYFPTIRYTSSFNDDH
ncbi:CHASE2 domain-containing protein [Larkinella bovis]|uniref:CHASE2 domain-containing protein n=1 Tax=Larkinella bovis TaxID=683041 RepID=A0ABW0IJS5_9BACT